MKIYYHSDLDGELSAFWILNSLSTEAKAAVQCLRCDYGKYLANLSIIEPGEDVFIVDYSIKPAKMLQLLETNKVVWIDHHVSAIKDYADFPRELPGLRRVGRAACELTWKYLNKTENEAPLYTRWIGDFDIQSGRYEDSGFFYYGCLAEDSSPVSTFWDHIVESSTFVERVLENGKIIIRYRDAQNKRLAKYALFETCFEGFKCQCLNHCAGNSLNFDLKTYDIGILFTYNGISYNVSLYTEKPNIDVSKLAARYGGGGHAIAAGFIAKDLSFLKQGSKSPSLLQRILRF